MGCCRTRTSDEGESRGVTADVTVKTFNLPHRGEFWSSGDESSQYYVIEVRQQLVLGRTLLTGLRVRRTVVHLCSYAYRRDP